MESFMRFTGDVIHLSKSGRIPLPKSVRKIFGIVPHSEVKISIENDKLAIRKHEPKCLVTGSTENVIEVLPGIPLSEKGMESILEELIFKNIKLR